MPRFMIPPQGAAELQKPPGKGGAGALLERLQRRLVKLDGQWVVDVVDEDVPRIVNYARHRSGGGWENRLRPLVAQAQRWIDDQPTQGELL